MNTYCYHIFTGLNKIREEYESWDWRFGRTPKFSVSRIFDVPDNLLGDFVEQNIPKMEQDSKQLTISMNVERGLINDVHLSVPKGIFFNSSRYILLILILFIIIYQVSVVKTECMVKRL